MKAVDKIKERIVRNRYGKAFLEQYGFKTTVLAFVSLIISFAFAVMNGVFGILDRSLWYGVLAGYYVLLIIFRSSVIIADVRCRRRYLQEPVKYDSAQNVIRLASGAFLVMVEIAMAAAVTQMVLAAAAVMIVISAKKLRSEKRDAGQRTE